MLAEREKLNGDLQRILDEQTESWGIKASNVELKHVDIVESMIRVIARQAEAERVRRAKIIEAAGEQQAAQKILKAATILATRPEAMQLRYLGVLMTIANERSSTIVFPFPTDLGHILGSARLRADGGSSESEGRSQFHLYHSGFVAVSADEHSRGIRAASWILGIQCTLGPPWCWPSWNSNIPVYTGAWLPFELYLNGFSIKIWHDVVLAPRATALLCSCLVLYFYFLNTRRIFDNSIAISVVACILLIFYPWYAWLSWAPMLDIYYLAFFLCGLYLFQLWLARKRDYLLLVSSLSMIVSTGFHSQSWLLVNAVNLFAGALALGMISRRSYSKAAMLICYAIASNCFIVLYLTIEFFTESRLFAFFTDHEAGSKPFYDGYEVSVPRKIAYYPHLVIESGKALWIFCLLSVVTIWTGDKERWKLLPFAVGVIALCAYSVFNVFSVPATAAPGRYALPFFVLFSPYAAHGLFVAATTLSRAKWVFLVAAVIFVVVPHAIDTLRFPHARDRAALEAGRHVGAAIDEPGPGATYMLEAEDWDFLAVMLTAAHYDRGLLDRSSLPKGRQLSPSLLSGSRSALLEYLEANNIKVVAVKSAELKVRLDEFDFAMRDRQIGPWSLYRIKTRGHSESEPGAAQDPP